jgi:HSP20 family protein
LPAVAREDVKVTADEGMITIQGERRHKSEQKDERFHRVESVCGTFWRSFSLPADADSGAVRCESKDGVLTVRIPKKPLEKAKPRQIKVE